MSEEKKNPMHDIIKNAEVGYTTKAEKQVKTEEVVAAIKSGTPVTVDAVQEKSLKAVILDTANALSGKPLSPLAASVLLKRLENAAEILRTEVLLGAANAEYQSMMAANPAAKVIPIEGGLIQKYTPKTQWNYPPNILAAEAQLKADKKVAEETGAATKVPKTIDPSKDTMFTIKA